MDLITQLHRRNGIARVQTLTRSGVSEHALRRAREDGLILGVRRGWVSLPGADPALVAAARGGVVITCVTLAVRRGLWVQSAAEPHVAAPPNSGHAGLGHGVTHWSVPLVPRDPDALEDSLENALVLTARCQPHEAAMAVWESALRRRLVDPDVLARMALPPDARRLLAAATPFADAGTETIFRTRLSWLDLPIVPQVWLHGHRVDFLIGERLVIQIDGGHHVGKQREKDNSHDALLRLHGYHVIRIGYDRLMNHWPQVQDVILMAIAQRLHLAH